LMKKLRKSKSRKKPWLKFNANSFFKNKKRRKNRRARRRETPKENRESLRNKKSEMLRTKIELLSLRSFKLKENKELSKFSTS
jgi:hypothetical protein